jgi:arabinofuranosyltransferase
MHRAPVAAPDTGSPRDGRVWLGVAVLAVAVVAAAWQLRFLCDDAYITFRYVANARDGHGLVWNPPPFEPVEGYTGFLWALLLWATWSIVGVEPPAAANVLSVALGLLLFLVCALAARRLRGRDGAPLPALVGLLALAVLAGNRTFLQWLTGGLETALFNLGFVTWVLLAYRAPDRRGAGWLALWSGAATVAALTRPDGLLPVAATAAAALWLVAARRLPPARAAAGLAPLLLVLAHLLWRRAFYGEWLPNTYYAKVTAPWPEAGWRYLYCFAFEHGAWLWPLVALAALAVAVARRRCALRPLLGEQLPALAATTAVLVHVGYYVLRVGGDHFEYRVLSHTIPLGTLATAALAARCSNRAWPAIATLLLLGAASSVGWLHLALTAPRLPPDYDALSDKLPAWAQPVTRAYDRHQAWLQMQFNCMRTGAHAAAGAQQWRDLPPRAAIGADPDDIPVVIGVTAGMLAWALPDVAVLDVLGLNDWVAARTPVRSWHLGFLPRERLEAALAAADGDGDGLRTRAELEAAFAAIPGSDPGGTRRFVDRLLLLFAVARPDALAVEELAAARAYFADLRFIAHERHAPADYVAAFDPNVTIVDRAVVVRPREVPLTAARVRAIEAEWRRRQVAPATR